MIEQRVHNISRFVQKAAAPELFMLRLIGGQGLAHLASEIYVGFGTYPGQNEKLAEHLMRLPIAMIDRAPTFTYEKNGQTRPLLEAASPYAKKTIPETVFIHENGRSIQVGFKDTRTLSWFILGAERLHRAVHIEEPRRDLYYHIINISKSTALLRGLPVYGV